MFTLPGSPTRKEALVFLSKSASYGNLGAFIGAGFSKAVLNDSADEIASILGGSARASFEKVKGRL